MKKILYLIFLFPLAINAQTWTGNIIEFVHPTWGSNSDYTALYRDDTQSDVTVLKLRMGDEYSSNFQIGYNFYVDGLWYTTFSVDGYGNGHFKGNVGIGTTNPGSFKLAVEGKIGAREINVTTAAWSDYVFNEDYKLRPLEEVNRYIKENKHLPEIPSAKEVIENGQNLGEMNMLLLKKIEELTLYLIDMKKENEKLKSRVNKLEEKLE